MKKLVILLIKLYQKLLSFDHGLPHRFFPNTRFCRFSPSCSQYSLEAINKYGIVKGGWLGFKRLVRCNPFNPGGFDPVS